MGVSCFSPWRTGVSGRPRSCLAGFPEWRDPSRIVHSLADMIRARIFAIACGYEDGNDLDRLRNDPAFKLPCGRLPDTDRDLCSQPTLSSLLAVQIVAVWGWGVEP